MRGTHVCGCLMALGALSGVAEGLQAPLPAVSSSWAAAAAAGGGGGGSRRGMRLVAGASSALSAAPVQTRSSSVSVSVSATAVDTFEAPSFVGRVILKGADGLRGASRKRTRSSRKVEGLSREEEVRLGRRIQGAIQLRQAASDLKESLQREPTQQEWIDAVGLESSTMERALQLGDEAKDRLITQNLGLVKYLVSRFVRGAVAGNAPASPRVVSQMQDLTQEATFGLIRAAEKFDPSRSCRFATYAQWWILKSLSESAQAQDRIIRVPAGVADLLSRMKRVRAELIVSLSRRPTDDELAEAVGISTEKLQTLFAIEPRVMSLDAETVPGGSYWDLADASGKVSLQRMLQADLTFVLTSFLNEEEGNFIRLRYGLDDGVHRSTSQTSLALGLTAQQGKAVYQRALDKLRKSHIMRETLEPYLAAV
jgi:RNA polymerase sigma factor (sigma-70 family)